MVQYNQSLILTLNVVEGPKKSIACWIRPLCQYEYMYIQKEKLTICKPDGKGTWDEGGEERKERNCAWKGITKAILRLVHEHTV